MFSKKDIRNKNKFRAGQAMLLTTTMIGGFFLLTTSIAGLVLFYQVQQATDAGNSTIAIYAADAALEEAAYAYFNDLYYILREGESNFCHPAPCERGEIALSNGATGVADILIPPLTAANASTTITARGKDAGQRTVRLLQTSFLMVPVR